jgi:hypothetical protein
MTSENPTECSDLIGKTIQGCRIFRDSHAGTEIMIDFTDGTSFNCCVQTPAQKVEAKLVICEPGTLETVRSFIDE